MLETHLADINEMEPGKLCTYLDNNHYQPIRRLLESLADFFGEGAEGGEEGEKVQLLSVLFLRLKNEIEQLMRNDTLIIFPLIRNDHGVNACAGRKLPLEMIHSKNKKIIYLLEKVKHMSNDYIAKPSWTPHFRVLCDELHSLDQQVMQAIYLKENVLLPKVEKMFNQPCKGASDQ